MANVRLGSIVADIRGSLGQQTYSRNKGGLYVKERTAPPYTRTADQAAARNVIRDLSKYWSTYLSPYHRTTWRDYALRYPRPDWWGGIHIAHGFTAFIRHNAYFYRIWEAAPFEGAPDAPPLHVPLCTFTANVATDQITVALPPLTYPTPPGLLRLFLFAGKPVPIGRVYFSSPWRYLDTNIYWPPWGKIPWTISYPWPIDTGKALWIYLVAQSQVTGAISGPARARTTT